MNQLGTVIKRYAEIVYLRADQNPSSSELDDQICFLSGPGVCFIDWKVTNIKVFNGPALSIESITEWDLDLHEEDQYDLLIGLIEQIW